MLQFLRLNPLRLTLVVLTTATILIALLIGYFEFSRIQQTRLQIQSSLDAKAEQLQDSLVKTLSIAHSLSALVQTSTDNAKTIDVAAKQLLGNHPSLVGLALAPGGIVTQQTQAVGIDLNGIDLLSEPKYSAAAGHAKNSNQFFLIVADAASQTKQYMLGILPVFMPQADGQDKFWGFVCVILNYPAVVLREYDTPLDVRLDLQLEAIHWFPLHSNQGGSTKLLT